MELAKKSTNGQSLRWLFKRARTARSWVILAVGLGWGSGILLIAQARLLANIVHGAFMDNLPRNVLWPYFVLLFGVVIGRAVLGWGREVAGFYAGAKVREEVRLSLMEHIFTLGPAYTSRQRTGALASSAMEHVEGLHDFYAFYLPQLAIAVMIPVAILAFVFPLSWAAGALLLLTAPLIPLFMVLVGMGAESISQRHFQALARISAHFLDVLQGITTLKLFDRSRGEERTIAKVSGDYRRRTMSVLRVAFLSSAVLEFFSSIAIALVAVYLGMSYLGYIHFGDYGKSLTLAGGLFILLLAPDFYLPLRELGAHYHARAEAIGASEEILKILMIPSPHVSGKTIALDASGPINIHCRDLYLAYEEGKRPALHGVSFQLKYGEKVALVGSSGAGKTTILNLLLGFLHPDQGRIMVNETPLADLDPEGWRQHIGWVGQSPVLFHGTIRENIRLGRPQASEEEIEQAARSARVLEFTQHLSEGLDTLVGEQGLGLSRGQAQRVALARAFLKDAPILLLDEPTSGLDSENERLILNALEELSIGRTVLMLTHRLANIEKADRIMVLAEGQIVEQGTYSALIQAGGVFQRLAHRGNYDAEH
ncbi:MAG: cysteine/glutathione ABC transporter permease/ATP-binding protein CydD [Deltaproteobacteria bacterium]|nr:MAG: cysteine/glutathione ABC transporter permease/ATP-binding protein CydD [Deltaproteobacteria bacterium]